MTPKLTFQGTKVHSGYLPAEAQKAWARALREVAQAAPMFHPQTRFGAQMSVQMTSAGTCGWVSDRRGYRYEPRHPSGVAWPDIPPPVLALWHEVTGLSRAPDCCLINYYSQGARMGLHQDRDEASFDWPVVSVSLGDDALFRVGGAARSDPTKSVWLHSGDVVVMAGAARLAFHGIDRIKFGTSTLLPRGGRINVTLRVVT